MSNPHEDFALQIDAYLDGEMSPDERAAFERTAAANPALADELTLQRRIDDRLRALLAPPSAAPALPQPLQTAPTPKLAGRPLALPRLFRLAAVLVLCAIGVWAALNRPWQYFMGPPPSDVAANVEFNELVKGGLKPIWVCGSEDEFKKYTRENLGQPLVVLPRPNLDLVGWTYASGLLDASAKVLMCRADGHPVIVVMGPKADDRRMHVDPGSDVRIHRRQLDGIVMYELSESDRPLVLNQITEPR